MEKYESKLIRELEIIIGLHVTKLAKIISELNSEGKKKWYDTLKEEVNEACSLLVEEASLFIAVHHYRKNCVKLCKILQIPMDPYDCEELTLYEEKKLLENRMTEYEDEITLRQERLETMNLKQIELCKLLEKVPMTFIEKTIPSETELEHLSSELEKLDKEYETLTEEFQETHVKIVNALTELNLQMKDDILNIITSIENHTEALSKERLRTLQEYYSELEILQKREEQQQLNSLKTTIDNLYEACHIMESERKFTKDIYSHSLDEIQTEINTLKTRLQKNGEQFALLARYQNYWKKLAKDVEEFHKTSEVDTSVEPILRLCADIRSIEAKLINCTIEFEQNNKESFTTFGKTIPEIIAGLHDLYGKYYVNDGTANRTLSNIITDFDDNSITATIASNFNKIIKSKYPTRKRSRETTNEDVGQSTSQCSTSDLHLPLQKEQQISVSTNAATGVSQGQDISSLPLIPSTSSTIQKLPPKSDATNLKSARLNGDFAVFEYIKPSSSSSQAEMLSRANVDDSGKVILKSPSTTQKCIKDKNNPVNSAIPSDKKASDDAIVTNPEFVCRYCNRNFKARRFLAVHEKVHTRNKNYCEICDKTFRVNCAFRQHLRSHKNTTATEIKIIDGPEDVTEPVESVTVQDLENLVFSFESPLLESSKADPSDITFEEIRTSFSTYDKETNGNASHTIRFENLPSSSNMCSKSNNKVNNTMTVNSDSSIEKRWKPNLVKCKKKHQFVPRWTGKFQQPAESPITPVGTKKPKVDVIQNLFSGLDLKSLP